MPLNNYYLNQQQTNKNNWNFVFFMPCIVKKQRETISWSGGRFIKFCDAIVDEKPPSPAGTRGELRPLTCDNMIYYIKERGISKTVFAKIIKFAKTLYLCKK